MQENDIEPTKRLTAEEKEAHNSTKTPSLFKDNEDSSDPEFDNIFNNVIYQSSSSSKSSSTSSLQKTKKKTKTHQSGSSMGGNSITKENPHTNNVKPTHQGLLVTCTNEIVAARTVQLLHSDNKEEKGTVVTAIGQPIVVAEELGEITSLNLSSNGQWLALSLSCFQIWIIQLSWKSVKQKRLGALENDVPKIISSVRHHATLEGHRARIHGLHFLRGSHIRLYELDL